MVLEQLRQWQAEGADTAPAEWSAAWDRALAVMAPLAAERPDGTVADGGAALAVALYVLARGRGVPPAAVTRDDVAALAQRPDGGTDGDVTVRWEALLRDLGHDLDDETDPVAARWRRLRTDNSPADAPDAVHLDHGSEYRWGAGYLGGIRLILSPWADARLSWTR